MGAGTETIYEALSRKAPNYVLHKLITPDSAKVQKDGHLPLHHAVMRRAATSVILALIEANPEALSTPSGGGSLPLHFAIGNDAPDEVIDKLLEVFPEATKHVNDCGRTALHNAAANSEVSLHVLSKLLKVHPDAAKGKDQWQQTPLWIATLHRVPTSHISLILEAYPDAARQRDTDMEWLPLHNALAHDAEACQLLLQAYPGAARELASAGGRPSVDFEYTPLQIAIMERAPAPVLAMLLMLWPEAAAKKDSMGNLPLAQAMQHGRFEDAEDDAYALIFEAHRPSAEAVLQSDKNATRVREQMARIRKHKIPLTARAGCSALAPAAEELLTAHMHYLPPAAMAANSKQAAEALAAALPAADAQRLPPARIEVLVIGAGLTGLSVAAGIMKEKAGTNLAMLDKSAVAGGVWSHFGNSFSRVNISGPSYRLPSKRTRLSLLHPYHSDVLLDCADVIEHHALSQRIYLQTFVAALARESTRGAWTAKGASLTPSGAVAGQFRSVCDTVVVCSNRRLGLPRQLHLEGEEDFAGPVIRGLTDDAMGVHWERARVVLIGIGAYAAEFMRTALERDDGASHCLILCRQSTTVSARVMDWLNLVRPWDNEFRTHPYEGSRLMGQMLVELYAMVGATMPRKFKPEGGTALLTDLFHLGYYMDMLQVKIGEVRAVDPAAVVAKDGQIHPADIIVKSVGFHPNLQTEPLLGRSTMCGVGVVGRGLFIKGEPTIDSGIDTNTVLASSIFYSVPLFVRVVRQLWRDDALCSKLANDKATLRVRPNWFNLSQWVQSYRQMTTSHAALSGVLKAHVKDMQTHISSTCSVGDYMAANAHEWLEIQRTLKPRAPPSFAKPLLPYPFEATVRAVLALEAPHLL